MDGWTKDVPFVDEKKLLRMDKGGQNEWVDKELVFVTIQFTDEMSWKIWVALPGGVKQISQRLIVRISWAFSITSLSLFFHNLPQNITISHQILYTIISKLDFYVFRAFWGKSWRGRKL